MPGKRSHYYLSLIYNLGIRDLVPRDVIFFKGRTFVSPDRLTL